MQGPEGWDARYASGETPWAGISEWVRSAIRDYDPTPKTVLDLGCGTGEKAVWLAEQGYEVTGIDFSGNAIALAKESSGDNSNPRFIRADLSEQSLEFPDVGLVLDLLSVQFLDAADQAMVFRKIAEHLSSDGVVLHARLEADGDEAEPWVRNLPVTPTGFEEALDGLHVVRHSEDASENRTATTVHRYVLKKPD